MTDLTPERLDELERLEKAMTPGVWSANCWQTQQRAETHSDIHSKHGREWLPVVTTYDLRENRNVEQQVVGDQYDDVIYIDRIGQANTEGIVALRNAAPALIAAARERDRWRDLYGTDEPSDGVIGTAVGKIVAERNRENNALKLERDTLAARVAELEGRVGRYEDEVRKLADALGITLKEAQS